MPLTQQAKRHLFRLLRAGFRLAPLPTATRDRLRQRFIERHSDLIPQGPAGKLPHAPNKLHRAMRHTGGRAIGYAPYRAPGAPPDTDVKIIAFYLPQFHAIPENDAWWGAGFTEWNNVTRALPQFEGHEQPRLPGELGFYDLRQPEVMRRQMQLAREYGVAAFCTYFYWFAGKTLLEAPLRRWLDDPGLSLPICLCWANENWSRRWDGRGDDILIGQEHGDADNVAFIAHVSSYLKDPRYLRVDGKPLLLVYRPGLLPSPKATAQRWREWCIEHDVGEIHLAYVQSFDRIDPRSIGFDSAVEFPPNNTSLSPITAAQQLINPGFQGEVLDWRELAHAAEAAADPAYPCFPGVNPGWDNEPRRSGRGRVFVHSSPRRYQQWLQHAIKAARRQQPSCPMVFVNAWNEWAEGAVLEPDTRLGYAWLEATRRAVAPIDTAATAPDSPPCVVIHVWHVDLLDELVQALRASLLQWRIVLTTTHERAGEVGERAKKLGLSAEIEVYEDNGRDVLPFLQVANRLYDEGARLVLKIHTKGRTHRQDGARWSVELVDKLLSPERAPAILAAFHRLPELGMVAADGHLQPLNRHLDVNRVNVEYLCRRLGIEQPPSESDCYTAGSMFWIRLDAMRPLLDAHLGLWEFEAEAGPADGTLSVAIERVFCLAATYQGFSTAEALAVCQ
ncbi:hypothetical protein DVT68_06405 [Dyella solisilvae]|uniref:Lipopolysaccharide biosynthesis protein n=1 Tax=Dyella solisilvae TaxID=1920168 RepID=A0A370KCN8_9GAMM|nr:glycoside hydrolase family 99-like domain-containing protein [Dyella solisilvae]RDJ00424.1 hypothetical protein DVT68_06405 [Dyella solisilvae]